MTVETINGGDQETTIKAKAVANFTSLIDDGSLTESDYNLDIGGECLSEFRTLCNSNFNQFYSDLTVAAVAATVTLTVDTLPTAGDTMTLGTTEYTFVASADFDTAGEIPITAADLTATQASIVAAINGTDTVNTAHASVTAGAFAANASTITANTAGTAGNSIDSTETFTAVTNIFSAATLTGGTDITPPAAMSGYTTSLLNGGDSWYTVRTKLNTLFGLVETAVAGL